MHLSTAAANGLADALAAMLGKGVLEIYGGPSPEGFGLQDGQPLLASFTLPTFSPAIDGVCKVRNLETLAVGRGRAEWFVAYGQDGEGVMTGKIGADESEDVDLVLRSPDANHLNIKTGDMVTIAMFAVGQKQGA